MNGENRPTTRRFIPIAVILGLACLVLPGPMDRAHSQSPPAGDPLLEARVDRVFAEFAKADSPGCAVAVIKSGNIIYERGYGMADLDHNLPITPTTVFHAASLAKQFTAMSIMLLVDRGKLSLEDDVHMHVPELHVAKPITIGDMLRHLSGLRDQWTLVTMAGWHLYDDVVTRGDVMDLVSRMKTLDFNPREGVNYSNTGYILAGLIVERVSGKSLGDFARDNIFVPLGMKNTSIIKTHGLIVPNRAYGYWTPEGSLTLELGMPNLDVTGPTNLLTTVEDLARWDRNFDDKTVGGDAVLTQMQTPARLSSGGLAKLGTDRLGNDVHYGLGLRLTKYFGLDVVEHDGRDAGYRSHLIRFPDQHFAVACLCNLALPDGNLPGRLVREVANIYLADAFGANPAAPAAGGAVPPAVDAPVDLGEYTGRYYSDEIDTAYNIELHGSSLVITRNRYPATPLARIPGSHDEFTMTKFSRPLPAGTVQFTRDATRRVDGLLISGSNRIHNFPLAKQH